MKKYYIGKVDRRAVDKAITKVSGLIEVPKELEIYAVESPEKFHLVLRRLPHSTQNIVKHAFALKKISFSTTVKRRKIIVVVLHKSALKHPDSLVGLLLHEITHIRQQEEGIADMINDSFQKVFLTKVARVHHPYFSTDELITTFIELGLISTLLLKDLYATTQIINSGNEKYVLAHYNSRFADKRMCPKPVNIKLLHRLIRKDLDLLVSAARFEAYMAAVLLPVSRIKTRPAKDLTRCIKVCYPTQTKDVENNCKPLSILYKKEFSYSKKFCRRFFAVMFEHFVRMMGRGEKSDG